MNAEHSCALRLSHPDFEITLGASKPSAARAFARLRCSVGVYRSVMDEYK